jgi:DNA polymerase-3 subunit delta'
MAILKSDTLNWNLIGHKWAVKLLQEHIRKDVVRHAYLFTGSNGIGRRTLALRFAQALNCPSRLTPGEPCLVCRTCNQIQRLEHMDLHIIKKPDDRTEIIVEQIRELQYHLMLSPHESRFKIALILDFERSSDEAQNALLKTLEDAPPRTILLLHAESPESLLPTIASRCEIIRLRPSSIQELSALLVQNRNISREKADELAHISSGKPGLALDYIENPEQFEKRIEDINDFFELVHSDLQTRFNYARAQTDYSRRHTREEREQMRGDIARRLQTWILLWRDILQLSAGSSGELVNLDFRDELNRLSQSMKMESITRHILDLQETLFRLNNTNLQLEIEVILLDLPRL